jgi:hypothetical protein
MIASSAGYLLLDNALAQAAAASLVLLMIWAPAIGITVARARR